MPRTLIIFMKRGHSGGKDGESFNVNHDTLQKGMYVSRIDGDVVTYDIRMKRPNMGDYVSNEALHTFEHLFATYARNSEISDKVIYIGPMGCRTGFYLLMRDTATGQQAIDLARESFKFIAEYEGEIPGAAKRECGNSEEHDLEAARAVAVDMVEVLKDWNEEKLDYDYEG